MVLSTIKKLIPGSDKNNQLATRKTKNSGSVQIIDPSSAIKSSTDVFSKQMLEFIAGNASGIGGYYTEQQLLGAYLSSVYAFAAVRRVQNLISRVRIVAEIENEDGNYVRVPDKTLINRIFRKDGSETLARMWNNYAVYGATAVYKVPTRYAVEEESRGLPIYRYSEGAVGGLYVLDKPRWSLDEDVTGTDIHGLHVMQYTTSGIMEGKNYLDREEFVYCTDWNPESPNYGKPLIAVAIHEAVANSAIAQWMSDYFTRGAMPFIMVSMEEDPELITDADLAKYKRQFEEYWQGINASLRSVFFDRKVNVEQVGIAAGDIAAPELNETALEGIASVIGIDRKLIVTTDGGSYSEHRQLVKRAWEDTVIPLAEKFVSAFNRDLGLPPNMRLVLDLSNISELEADRDERTGTEISVYDAGLQDYNETRTKINQPPIKELDGWFNFDGKPTPLEKIVATRNVPPADLQEYAGFLWDSNLARKSRVLQVLGMELEPGDKDGYQYEFTDYPDFITGLWGEDLLTRKQVLGQIGIQHPIDMEDGYRSELERGADYGDFVEGLWSSNLLTRSQTMQMLDLGISVPEGAPDGYADEIGNRKDNLIDYWGNNLITKSEIMRMLNLPVPDSMQDGFMAELEAVMEAEAAAKQEYIDNVLGFWDGDLLKKSDAAKLLRLPFNADNDVDGYQPDIEKIREKRYGVDEQVVSLWGENLMTKKQVLDTLGIAMPEDKPDGYQAEVEALTETTIGFQTDDMTRERDARIEAEEAAKEQARLAEEQKLQQESSSETENDEQGKSLDNLEIEEDNYFDNEEDWQQIIADTGDSIQSAEDDMLTEYSESPDETPLTSSYTPSHSDVSEYYPPQSLPTDENYAGDIYSDEQIETLMNHDYYENSAVLSDMMNDSENDQVVEKELYISLWMANDPNIQSVQDQVKKIIGESYTVDWQSADTYHTTLLYAPNIDDEKYEEIRQLIPNGFPSFDVSSSSLGTFDIGNQTVVYIDINRENTLLQLQKKIADIFISNGVELSPFSIPTSYNPHITLGYVDGVMNAPDLSFDLQVTPLMITIGRDGYDIIDEISLVQVKAIQEDAITEFKTWEKASLKNGKNKALKFETVHIDADTVRDIKTQLELCDNKSDIKAVFDSFRERFTNDDD